MDRYIACICEGAAERAIIDILLDNHKLVFERSELLEEETIKSRDGETFAKRYLRMEYDNKITVYRVMDSRNERFKLGKAYQDKVEVVNVITAPEIEMLIIHNEGKYESYLRSKLKPSEFCKKELKYHEVKKYKFVKRYFENCENLIDALRTYKTKSKTRANEKTIADLLR